MGVFVKMNGMIERSVSFLFAVCMAILLGSCGSGAVSSASDPALTFTLSPATATAYSGVPITLSISGGGGRSPYTLSSTNATILPVPSGPVSEAQVVLTPNAVSAQQSVTVSVMDQAGKTATSVVAIQPNLVNGDITITGTAPPAFPTCAGVGIVCAGQSGTATLTLTQNGAPARGRSVRFDVVQGSYRFPVDVSQSVFSTSVTVTSDESGRATTVLRADTGASPQIATIRTTDLSTGAFRTATFLIKQSTLGGGEFVTVPPEWKVAGTFKNECPGGAVDYLIFGGTPPYSVRSSNPQGAGVSPALTSTENPSRFSVFFAAAACGTTGYQVLFTVTDATGLSIRPILTVTPGTEDRPTPPPAIILSPTSVSLACGQSAQVLVTITNPGTTAPTITTSVGTPLSSTTALGVSISTSGVITLVRGSGSVGTGATPATPVIAAVTVGAGSATPQTIAVSTQTTCP